MMETVIICDPYEQFLAHNQHSHLVGDGITECRCCAKELNKGELDDNENVDPEDKKICWVCLDRYYEFHPDVEVEKCLQP